MTSNYRMKYPDADGVERQISEPSIRQLEVSESHAPVGRYEVRNILGVLWINRDIARLEDAGLLKVKWLEPGDEKREGGWVILGVTEVASEVLKKWRSRRRRS